MARRPPATDSVYQLKIALDGITPLIWRRVLVSPDTTLQRLHAIIQISMGWENSHLHQFTMGNRDHPVYASDPAFELGSPVRNMAATKKGLADIGFDLSLLDAPDFRDSGALDEAAITLGQAISVIKRAINYEYDFGDSWIHSVYLEEIVPSERGASYPLCVTGERACPPEDCGGVGGYVDFLQTIADPDSEDHEDALEWVGGEFDPEEFDLNAINEEYDDIDLLLADGMVGEDFDFEGGEMAISKEDIEDYLDTLIVPLRALVSSVTLVEHGIVANFEATTPLACVLASQLVPVLHASTQSVKLTLEVAPPPAAVRLTVTGDPEEIASLREMLQI